MWPSHDNSVITPAVILCLMSHSSSQRLSGNFILNWHHYHGIIPCMRPANERQRYGVTPSLIGRVHTENDPLSLPLPSRNSIIKHLRYHSSMFNHDDSPIRGVRGLTMQFAHMKMYIVQKMTDHCCTLWHVSIGREKWINFNGHKPCGGMLSNISLPLWPILLRKPTSLAKRGLSFGAAKLGLSLLVK